MRQFSKLITAGRTVITPVRNGSSLTSNIKPMSMNEMPVPSGSWSEHYNAKQKAYNLQLIAGVAITIATLFVGIQSEAFYMNWGPEMKNKK